MDFPFYSAHQIWQELSNETIGFYTSKTKNNIPDVGGIYAWFLPLDLSGELDQVIRKHKKYFSYDASSKGVYSDTLLTNYQWQRINITANAVEDYNVEKSIEERWKKIRADIDSDRFKSVLQLFTLSSIFSKPLYIGLTKNLASRYEQHTTQTSDKNSFYKRFLDFQDGIQTNLRIEDLLFVAIPVKLGDDPQLEDDVIKILEYLLKNVVGPIYGEK